MYFKNKKNGAAKLKKLSLNADNWLGTEILSREELKKTLGGLTTSAGSGSGSNLQGGHWEIYFVNGEEIRFWVPD